MKKSLLALAVLGAFAGVASAQSSVTIYGIVDAGVGRIDNGAAIGGTNGLATGGNNSSRIGFKGVEDLGSGLKATFVLEDGFNADDGSQPVGKNGGSTAAAAEATNQAFSRLAYVGLEGNFGAVRLGRQNSQLKVALAQIDPFETSGMVNAITFFTGTQVSGTNPERVSNQVTYTTANYSGFSGQLGYTFGESAGDSGSNSTWGVQAGYANGPLNVQFAYNDQDLSTAANVTQGKTKITLLGATYDFNVVKLHAAYGQKKFDSDVGTLPDLKVTTGLIGVTVPFGASKVRAEYIRNNDDRDNFDNHVAAISYSYALSKRTQLYATYARVNNDANSSLNFGTGNGLNAGTLAGQDATGTIVGIQHNF